MDPSRKELEMDTSKLHKMLEDRVDLFAKKTIANRTVMKYPHSEPTQRTVQNMRRLHYRASWCTEFWNLYKRANIQHMRSLPQKLIKVVSALALVCFGALIYYNVFGR